MYGISPKVLSVWLPRILVVASCVTIAASALAKQPTFAQALSQDLAVSPVTSAPVTLRGTVTYDERDSPGWADRMIGNQVLTVRLLDITRANASPVVLGEQTVESAGTPIPCGFDIVYDPLSIRPKNVYGVQATIEVDGRLTFESTTTRVPLEQGHLMMVEVVLTRIEPSSFADMPAGLGRLAHFSY